MGDNTKFEIIALKKELTELLGKGGFRLHKWKTNLVSARNDIQTIDDTVDIYKEGESRLLGVLWNPHKDIFQYRIVHEEED